MRKSFLMLAAWCALRALASPDGGPFLVEAKVQNDLENALSRLITREQFFVQVTTDIKTTTERRLVEGETITNPTTEAPEPYIPPMPGFLPEYNSQPRAPKSQQLREVYRLVETPVLAAVRVHVSFDDSLKPIVVTRARSLVQAYLTGAYPGRAIVTFGSMPMLKPEPEKKSTATPDRQVSNLDEEEEDPNAIYFEYAKYGLIAIVVLSFLMFLTRNRNQPEMSRVSRGMDQLPSPQQSALPSLDSIAQRAAALLPGGPTRGGFGGGAGSPTPVKDVNSEIAVEIRRKRLLDVFMARSQAFRLYYQRLADDHQAELFAALRGLAFESLLEGLSLHPPPATEQSLPNDLSERLEHHERTFDEFVKAKDWKDRQFFGFLQQLSDEQIIALINHETPMTICIMLRFMRANQSALVLDSLPADRRMEVLSFVSEIQHTPFSKIAQIEKTVRDAVLKMPDHFFGSRKEDIDFWGTVISNSANQDSLLSDLERTQPEIYPNLAKYKFKLEDASTLPNSLVEKVLSEADNEEVGLAMASLPANVVEVLLDAVSKRRREFLEGQMDTYRNGSPEAIEQARATLTKRFREVLT